MCKEERALGRLRPQLWPEPLVIKLLGELSKADTPFIAWTKSRLLYFYKNVHGVQSGHMGHKKKTCVIFHDKMIKILGFFSPERNFRGVLGQRRVGGARDIKDKTFVPHNIRQIMQRLGREAGQCGLSGAREIKVFSRLIGQDSGLLFCSIS